MVAVQREGSSRFTTRNEVGAPTAASLIAVVPIVSRSPSHQASKPQGVATSQPWDAAMLSGRQR